MNEEINEVIITVDTDWAPDFAIKETAEILLENKVGATWFITHDSVAVRELFDHSDLFEIGIHPNFLPGSTQGKNRWEVMDYLMNIVPNAKAVRTHAMFYDAALSRMFALDYDLEIDSSIFLGEMPHIIPLTVLYGRKVFLRMPYFWSDDGEMSIKKLPSFEFDDKKFSVPGLKILDFHPIHVCLNSENLVNYNILKEKHNVKNCSVKETVPFVNSGKGSRTLLIDVIKGNVNCGRFRTISEIATEWKKLDAAW